MALWDKIGSIGDVEDRRGGAALAVGGGIGGLILTAAVLFLSGQSGTDILTTILNEALQGVSTSQQQPLEGGGDDYKAFAERVLGSTNEYWSTEGRLASNQAYVAPGFVLFRGATTTGCGIGSSQTGPFYCPSDNSIYLDETFFDDIRASLNANTGDVAQAYVIAHEVGHHVQNLEGSLQGADPIATELQADCYAGAWANSIKGIFESPNEVNEALQLSASIGDDKIQQKTEGQVNPETWTHGSAEQRQAAFSEGYASGNPSVCR